MPKQVNYTLSRKEVIHIERAMKQRDSRLAQRALIIYALHQGKRAEEVVKLHHVSLSKVYATWKRYQLEGVEGLKNRPVSGRPLKATDSYRSLLKQVIEEPPATFGYEFSVWTAERLRLHLREATGIELSESTLLNVLSQMEYVYRRPKKDLTHRQDEADRERFKQRLEELKKGQGVAISAYSLWTKVDSS